MPSEKKPDVAEMEAQLREMPEGPAKDMAKDILHKVSELAAITPKVAEIDAIMLQESRLTRH